MSFDRLSVRDIAADVMARRRSAVQVVQDSLDRVAEYDRVQPQTWIERVHADAALAAASAVDARIAAGERLPLAGVPFTVKDNIDVAGLPTTAGCPAFAYVPDRSATVVDRLTAAGAVLIGKTNLDQFATGLVGVRSPYGAPGCVFNREYVSGGSSSGSAVATAAGLVAFALGTDTAGSGRVPAAINQLVGLKPTRGRWSTRGLVPACRSLDCITVFSATVADAAVVDEVLAAFDVEDPYSRRAGPEPGAPDRPRIAVPRADQLNWFGDAQSAKLFASARARVAALGDVIEMDVAPLLEAAQLLYQGPWVAERAAAVEALLRDDPGAIEPTVRTIIQDGLAYTAVDAFKGAYALQAHLRTAEAFWTQADVLLLPTAPTIYRIAEVRAAPVALNANLGVYTNFVNLLDMSAVALPAGARANNTGFGVSLIGPAWADRMLLDLAARYEAQSATDELPPLDLGERTRGVALAVVGAHLSGMPLHWQLTSRNARLVARTRTAPTYRLYAMTNATPLKPALIHVGDGGDEGAAVEVEVYELDVDAFGSFVTEVPGPLAIGTVTLADGEPVKGFVAEPRAMQGADDVTAFGGWRAYIASRAKAG